MYLLVKGGSAPSEEAIADDVKEIEEFREISILIASLICDIQSERIASAGHLGDWISVAKDLMVSCPMNFSPFLMTYVSFRLREGMTNSLTSIQGCNPTSGNARLSPLSA